MALPQRPKVDFKAPEGEYRRASSVYKVLTYWLHAEALCSTFYNERHSRSPFSNTKMARLTLAELPAGSDGSAERGGTYIIFNVQDFVHITEHASPDKDPIRSIYVNTNSGQTPTFATAHAHAAASDGIDLLIGLSTGDVLASSLAGQLATRSDVRRQAFLHCNVAGATDGSRVAGVAWLPGSRGIFVAGHASGNVFFYQKRGSGLSGASVTTQLRSVSSVQGSEPLGSISTGSPINALAASPNGASLAVACADGVLRIYDAATRRLTGGFKSYSGGLLCCAWSPKGDLITAGGEDDLVCLYSVEDCAVVAWGGGHTSWVSAIAFDPTAHLGQEDTEDLVRVISGGQDAQMALWDFDLSPAALTPVSPRAAGRPPASGRQLSFPADGRAGAAATNGTSALGLITQSAPHADMDIQTPVRIRKLHSEPVSAVLPTPLALFMASHSGVVRCWQRPRMPQQAAPAAPPAADGGEEQMEEDVPDGPAAQAQSPEYVM